MRGPFKVTAISALQGSTSVCVTHQLSLASVSLRHSKASRPSFKFEVQIQSLTHSPRVVPWSLVLCHVSKHMLDGC